MENLEASGIIGSMSSNYDVSNPPLSLSALILLCCCLFSYCKITWEAVVWGVGLQYHLTCLLYNRCKFWRNLPLVLVSPGHHHVTSHTHWSFIRAFVFSLSPQSLHGLLQSGFCSHSLTETAVTLVSHDFHPEEVRHAVLSLVVLWAAFDFTDHLFLPYSGFSQ